MRLSQIGSWSRNGIHGLLQLRVNSFSGLILEHTGRLSLFFHWNVLTLILPIGEIKVISEVIVINRMRNFPLLFGLIERQMISLVKGVSPVVLGFFEHGRFIILVLLIMMKHVLLLLRNEEPILQLSPIRLERNLTLSLSLTRIDNLLLLFFEIIE